MFKFFIVLLLLELSLFNKILVIFLLFVCFWRVFGKVVCIMIVSGIDWFFWVMLLVYGFVWIFVKIWIFGVIGFLKGVILDRGILVIG